jgi:pimeloyl-ACP methyl ester carboxylesterase
MTQETIAAVEPVSRRFTSQGISLHYLDWGNEGAPPLLLLHGNMDHARSWDWVARALSERWHVIALDLRGHGDSDWSAEGSYLTPYHVVDLAELIDSLGYDKVTIVGHSFGGNVSWRYTALYPDRVEKLVIVDGLGPTPDTMAEWARTGPLPRLRNFVEKRRDPATLDLRVVPDVADGARRIARRNQHLTPDMAHHLALHGLRAQGDGYVWKYDPRVAVFAPEDFDIPTHHFWSAIPVPVLLYYGTESWTTDPEKDGRAHHFPDRRTIVYENAGHWVHHDRFDEFMASLNEFLG